MLHHTHVDAKNRIIHILVMYALGRVACFLCIKGSACWRGKGGRLDRPTSSTKAWVGHR
jgi:hypothetical protein